MGVVSRLWRGPADRTVLDDRVYWARRARDLGPRAVLHVGHGTAAVPAVTRRQERILFPLLTSELAGTESVILDFGCGTGRFTPALADLIRGRAVGVDPTAWLLAMAPVSPRVDYILIQDGRVPLAGRSVDVVWVSIVLGCITGGESLRRAASEIRRVLKPGGLLFLVENTSAKPSGPHFVFRSVEDYRALFHDVDLIHRADYVDLGETISVLSGRRGN